MRNETIANASADISAGFADLTGLGPLVVLLMYAVGVPLAAEFIAPWLAQSQILSRLGRRFATSVSYAIKGFAATAVLSIVATPIYLLATADGGTQSVALEVIGVGIGAYVALVVVGMLADRAVTAFIDAHPDLDEWGDLFPDKEAESTEAVADGGREVDG